jgi:hypothetical protein
MRAMLARDRADAVVTAQELQRVIAAQRALGRRDRRGSARRPGSSVVAPVTVEAVRVAPVLRAHDARAAPRH